MIKRNIRIAGVLMLATTAACGIDRATFAPALDPSLLVGNVMLEHRAFNLATAAPYDTVQLRTAVYSGTGQRIDVPVTYTSDNPMVVTIDESGLMQVTGAGTTVIRASATSHGATRMDTAVVNVIAGTPTAFVAEFKIEPNPGDSAKHAVPSSLERGKVLRITRLDSAGRAMTTLRVAFWSSDTATAIIAASGTNVQVTPRRPGRVYLHLSTYAYGQALHDSLSFLAGWPVTGTINAFAMLRPGTREEFLNLTPTRITIGVGGCVIWGNNNRDYDMDIVFDDSSAAGTSDVCRRHSGAAGETGNIAPFRPDLDQNGNVVGLGGFRARSFSRPGVYTFRSTLHGVTGTIVVCDEVNDPQCSPENYKWGSVNQ
jgi:hypothetical protein